MSNPYTINNNIIATVFDKFYWLISDGKTVSHWSEPYDLEKDALQASVIFNEATEKQEKKKKK